MDGPAHRQGDLWVCEEIELIWKGSHPHSDFGFFRMACERMQEDAGEVWRKGEKGRIPWTTEEDDLLRALVRF